MAPLLAWADYMATGETIVAETYADLLRNDTRYPADADATGLLSCSKPPNKCSSPPAGPGHHIVDWFPGPSGAMHDAAHFGADGRFNFPLHPRQQGQDFHSSNFVPGRIRLMQEQAAAENLSRYYQAHGLRPDGTSGTSRTELRTARSRGTSRQLLGPGSLKPSAGSGRDGGGGSPVRPRTHSSSSQSRRQPSSSAVGRASAGSARPSVHSGASSSQPGTPTVRSIATTVATCRSRAEDARGRDRDRGQERGSSKERRRDRDTRRRAQCRHRGHHTYSSCDWLLWRPSITFSGVRRSVPASLSAECGASLTRRYGSASISSKRHAPAAS